MLTVFRSRTGFLGYAPLIQKMMARARFLSNLPLSLQEKTEVFAIWIEPVVFLTARAYYPTAGVQSQLKLVQRMALGLNSWGITAQILSEVRGRGGL